MRIFNLIPVGEKNAIPKAELIRLTGLSERSLRLAVHQERRMGNQILTNCDGGGYYLPESTRDVTRFIKSMRHRAAETAAVADALEAALETETGQERMEGC